MIGTVINGYKILREIGKGGMATVYYGENTLGKKAAIKVLNDEFSTRSNLLNRFLKEADIMMALDKEDGICQVYDRTISEGQYVIIMEYLEGMSLKQYVRDRGPIHNFDQLRTIARQVLTTLGEAHRLGIVHRDIKPSNLFYTTDGKVKILDFGISKVIQDTEKEDDSEATDDDGTTTKQKLGTLAYMSPEQIKCTADVDQRTDIYSFGISLYFLMTGKDPLLMEDDSLTEIHDMPFQQAIRHATRKDRDKRTPDCGTFLKEINALPKSDPVKRVKPEISPELARLRSELDSAVCPVSKRDTTKLKRVFWVLLLLFIVEIGVVAFGLYTYDNEYNRNYAVYKQSSVCKDKLEALQKNMDIVTNADKNVWQVQGK